MNVLSEMINISIGFKRCQLLYDDDVNSIMLDITVFLNGASLPRHVHGVICAFEDDLSFARCDNCLAYFGLLP